MVHPSAPANALPRTYHHGDLRRVLLQAATDALAAAGPHALSLREVSRSAGVSHSAAYRHFPNKENLLAALAEEGFRGLAAEMRRGDGVASSTAAGAPAHADARAGGGRDACAARLVSAGNAYVAFGVAHPALLQLMFGGQTGDPGDHPALDEAATAAYAVLRETIEDGQRQGVFRAGDPATLALAAWSLVHGLALLYAGNRAGAPGAPAPPADQASAALGRLLLVGIEAR